MDKMSVSGVFRVRTEAKRARKKHLEVGMEGESSIQVKGTLLADLVSIIRTNEDKGWGQYLVPQDMELINGCVLSSDWYPLGPFRRMGEAVFNEVAGSNMENVRAFGKKGVDRFLTIYQNLIVPGDPVKSIRNLVKARGLFVKGDFKISVSNGSPNLVRNFISRPPEIPETHLFEAFCYQVAGVEEAIVLKAGGRAVTSQVVTVKEGCEIVLEWLGR